MEIYDANGQLIARSSDVSKTPLDETRQAGERKREEWLLDIAKRSRSEGWGIEKAREIVDAEINATPNLRAGAVAARSEGLLACDSSVRSEFERLQQLRDEVWRLDQDFLKRVKHGPSQLLIDILRRQSRDNERKYVATTDTYLDFMHWQYA
ncbi:MAG TPA: hypothetical protein VGI28_09665 [Stellaceae bacterium]